MATIESVVRQINREFVPQIEEKLHTCLAKVNEDTIGQFILPKEPQ